MYHVVNNPASAHHLKVGTLGNMNVRGFRRIIFTGLGSAGFHPSKFIPFDDNYTLKCEVKASITAPLALIRRMDCRARQTGHVGVEVSGVRLGVPWGLNGTSSNLGALFGKLDHFIPLKVTQEWLDNQAPKEIVLGSRVEIVDQTNGWGTVKAGEVGTVLKIDAGGIYVHVDGNEWATNWRGQLRCFRLLGGQHVAPATPTPPPPKMLEKGTAVTIDKNSSFYQKADFLNPIDTIGEVVSIHAGNALPVIVKWPSGVQNNYGVKDLKVS